MTALQLESYPNPQASRTSYPLTPQEVLWMGKNLTQSAQNLLLYCRALDPFGNKTVEFQTSELARLFDLSVKTIQRAIAQLAELDLITLESVSFRVRGSIFGGNVLPLARVLGGGQKRRDSVANVATASTVSPLRQERREQALEPLPAKDSEEPKSIEIHEFIQKKERETLMELPKGINADAYRKWLIEKAKKLPEPPTLYERWADTQMLIGSHLRQYLASVEGAQNTGEGQISRLSTGKEIALEPVPMLEAIAPVAKTEASEQEARLERLAGMWRRNQGAGRKIVREQITENGEAWGIGLAATGPYLLEDGDNVDF